MRTILAVVALTAACTAVPVGAQAPAGNTDIDEIIVTGARSPVSASLLGSATTVITRDVIESRQARYVTDVLRTVPGIAVAQSGGLGAQTQVRVRGSEANHVLVLIDGVRANDPATSDEFRWEYLTTSNVERIEIVRGPQSALWGSEAIGAVINVVSRASAERSGIDSYIETGSNNTVNAGANVAGGAGAWTFGGGAEALDTDGSNISRTGSENDGADLSTATLNAHYGGSDRWRLDAGLRGVTANSQFDPVDAFATGLPVDGNVATDSRSWVGSVNASLSTERGVTWHMRARYFDSLHRNLVDDLQDSSSASTRVSYAVQSDIDLGGNRLTFALEHEDTDYEQRGAVVFGDPNQDQSMQLTSAIAEYQLLTPARFSWIFSGRFDKHSDFDDIATGRIATAYQWDEATRLRASVGIGHKTPTFTDRFGFFPQQFVGNPDLKPEKSLSLDLGIDRTFLDGAVFVRATAFWQELEDEIDGFVFDPITFLATAANRPGKSDRSGIELAAEWKINDLLGLGATYTHTNATEEDALGQRITEIRRPENAGSLMLEVASPTGRLQATLVADYGGTRSDVFFPPFPDPQRTVALASYWLLDLTVQFRVTDSVALVARGTNVLDEQYEQVYGYRTLGRAAYLGIRADFGRTR